MEDFFACSNNTNSIPPPLNGDDDAAYIRNAWQHFDEHFGDQTILFNPFDFSSTGETTPGLSAGSTVSTPTSLEQTEEARSDGGNGLQPDMAPALADDQSEAGDENTTEVSMPELMQEADVIPELLSLEATGRDTDCPSSAASIKQQLPPEQVARPSSMEPQHWQGKSTKAAKVVEFSGSAAVPVEQSSSATTVVAQATKASNGRKRRAEEQVEVLPDSSIKRRRFAAGSSVAGPSADGLAAGHSTALVRTVPLAMSGNPYASGSALEPFPGMPPALHPGMHLDSADESSPALASRHQPEQPVQAGSLTGSRTHDQRGQEQISAAQAYGQRAQKQNNTITRLNRAFKKLIEERSGQLKAEAKAIIDLENAPASALPAPKTLSDDDKERIGELARGGTARAITANAAGYVTCQKCMKEYGLDDELVINKQSALLRHSTEYHSSAACSACGMPVAGRDTKAFRRHRAVCAVFHALVKSGRHWDWLLEYGLVRADVQSMGNEFFNRDERLAAKGADDSIESLRKVMKYGEIKKLRKSLKLAPEEETDAEDGEQDETEGEPEDEAVAGPSKLHGHQACNDDQGSSTGGTGTSAAQA